MTEILGLIADVNPNEIAAHIAVGTLADPCAFCEYDGFICDGKCEDKTVEYIVEEWLKREKDKCI